MNNDLLLNDDLSWFEPVRVNLLSEWQTKTVIDDGKGNLEPLACSLLQFVNTATGHLSLACSLHGEAEQIEKLLSTPCFDDDPVVFFRLLLFLLDEFTARMKECSKLFGKDPFPKQPTIISVWTNRYAKHRTALLVRHHAQHLFEDEPRFNTALTGLNKHGKIELINTEWLKAHRTADIPGANRDLQSLVLIPPLTQFLTAAIGYYGDFLHFACLMPQALEQFQSPHHWNPIDLMKT